jgi:hypothetical protein
MDRRSKETLKNVIFEDVIIIDVKIYAINIIRTVLWIFMNSVVQFILHHSNNKQRLFP